MNYLVDIFMLIIICPILLIIYFVEYPKKWRERKYIYGVTNREEFKEEKNAARIEEIVASCRKSAGIILILSFIMVILFCFIPDYIIKMIVFSVFIFFDFVFMFIPHTKGNRELKNIKRELGIASTKGVVLTDLKSAGAIHALKKSSLIVPDIIALVFFLAALLADLGIVKIYGLLEGQNAYNGHIMVGMAGVFLLVNLMIIPIALMMDNIRNEVISEDSDVNTNYNRAKKKNMANFSIMFSWINTAFIIVMMCLLCVWNNEEILFAIYVVYMFSLIVGSILLMNRQQAIEKIYKKETTIENDEDDNWILGQLYYNPKDHRLNINKRVGFGSTINLAHPVGKAVGVVLILVILGVFVELVYVGIIYRTPLSVRVEDGKLICHQMKDDYTIDIEKIDELVLKKDPENLVLQKQYGLNANMIYNGKFVVNGEKNCLVFMNLESDSYIDIRTKGKTYYISGSTEKETKAVYDRICEEWEK